MASDEINNARKSSKQSKTLEQDPLLAVTVSEILQESTNIRDITKRTLSALETRMEDIFTAHAENINRKYDILHGKVNKIERDLMDLQQYIRRPAIEISGISETVEQRDLQSFVINQILTRTNGYKLSEWDIQACHRLRKRDSRQPAHVIVLFVNRKDAINAVSGRYKLKSYAHLKNIWITDNLCPQYQEIFDELKSLQKDTKR